MTHHDDVRIPPIETLSDIAWQRVERAVFAELDAAAPASATTQRPGWLRRAWVPATSVLAAAAAAAVVLAWPREHAPASGDATPVRIATGATATDLVLGEASITVATDSAVLVSCGAADGVTVILERGEVDCAVAPRHGRPPFVVLAGTVRVEVVGTRFTVTRDGDRARLAVSEGTVVVIADGARAEVHAGEAWPPTASATADRAGAGTAAGAGTTAGASSADDDDEDPAPAIAAAAPQPHAGRAPTPDAKARYEQAAALEASDPAAALAGYRALARGRGPWAGVALFAAGRLSLDRGDLASARTLFERYLRRHPDGANAADARALLARLLAPPSPTP